MSILLIAERHGGDDVQRQSRDMRCKYGAAAADVGGKKGTELLGRARQGDADARLELIGGNLRLVLSVVQRFSGRCDSLDDLFQVGDV